MSQIGQIEFRYILTPKGTIYTTAGGAENLRQQGKDGVFGALALTAPVVELSDDEYAALDCAFGAEIHKRGEKRA